MHLVARLPAEGAPRRCRDWKEGFLPGRSTSSPADVPVRGPSTPKPKASACQRVRPLEPSCTALRSCGESRLGAGGGPSERQQGGQLVGLAPKLRAAWGKGRVTRSQREESRHEPGGACSSNGAREQPRHPPSAASQEAIRQSTSRPASSMRAEANHGAQSWPWTAVAEGSEVPAREPGRRFPPDLPGDAEADGRVKWAPGARAGPGAAAWVPLVQEAACCSSRKECMHLLRSMAAAGYDLPLRLIRLASQPEAPEKEAAEAGTWEDLRHLLTSLWGVESPSMSNVGASPRPSALAGEMANALMDLLWRFGQHKAALGVLLIGCSSELRLFSSLSPAASQPNPFWASVVSSLPSSLDASSFGSSMRAPSEPCGLWKLDVSSLGAGGSLAALHCWLDSVQDLALTGAEPPGHALIATGGSRGDSLLVRRTLHYHLWARSAPVWITEVDHVGLQCKGYSLFRWIKDSPHCLSFELHDLPFVPEMNGLKPFEGGLVTDDVAHVLELLTFHGVPMQRPKVFSRLLRITDEKRNQWIKIQAEMTESRKERAEKRAKMKAHNRARRQKRRLENKPETRSPTKRL